MFKKSISFILLINFMLFILFPVRVSAASPSAGKVTLTNGTLNIRHSSSSTSAVIGSLKNGSYITLLSKSGSWWNVEYASGKFGYCHSAYITPLETTPATVKITDGFLNVRTGAGTAFSVSNHIFKGESVLVLSSSGAWSKILYHGTKIGYVHSKYLSFSSSYSSISLNVPNFKQSDSRWAQTLIGNSGKPMSQIGCATTSIAMIESYRTKKTIFPDEMSQKLRYTDSGNVYWPAHYTVTTDNENYLHKIYEQLKLGKPILFGAKTAYGKQHWVVITGFIGGSLTTDRFTINDPGSVSRTNLQHFLNNYPLFYKFFF